jgi:hypothetical protein
MKLIKKTIPKLYAFKKGYSVTDKLSLNKVSDVLFFKYFGFTLVYYLLVGRPVFM